MHYPRIFVGTEQNDGNVNQCHYENLSEEKIQTVVLWDTTKCKLAECYQQSFTLTMLVTGSSQSVPTVPGVTIQNTTTYTKDMWFFNRSLNILEMAQRHGFMYPLSPT